MTTISDIVLNIMYQQTDMEIIEADIVRILKTMHNKMFVVKTDSRYAPNNRFITLTKPLLRRRDATVSVKCMMQDAHDKRYESALKETARDIRVLISQKNAHGDTPLTIAVRDDMSVVMDILLNAGAKPNKRDKTGWTPLHYAARDNRIDIMVSLLCFGADKEAMTRDGETAQGIAYRQGNVTFMQVMTRTVMTFDKK